MNNKCFGALALAAVASVSLVSARPDLFHTKLTKDQEVLHALGRLTYGARPGVVPIEAVTIRILAVVVGAL